MAGLPTLSDPAPGRGRSPARARSPATPRKRPSRGGWPTALVEWFQREARPLPWRETRDPYRILVAEVLLQQTRVDQALPFYHRFLRRFPTLDALARAREPSVLKAWEGAGYYARARHLRALARTLVREQGGRFPRSARELSPLPGVGPYTSRAVAALAFGEKVVALDSNGVRVLSRLELSKGGPAELGERADRALGELPPRAFNEALMELGQRYCLPRRPRCRECPLRGECLAVRKLADPGVFPPRRPAPARVREEEGRGVLVSPGGRVLLHRRPSRGLLGGLWELPGGRIRAGEEPRRGVVRTWKASTGIATRVVAELGRLEQEYSHRHVVVHVFQLAARGSVPQKVTSARWVRASDLPRLALPRVVHRMRPWIEEALRRHRAGEEGTPGSFAPGRVKRNPRGPFGRGGNEA